MGSRTMAMIFGSDRTGKGSPGNNAKRVHERLMSYLEFRANCCDKNWHQEYMNE